MDTISVLDLPDIYRRAADLLMQRGWTRQEYEDAQGHLCIDGAVHLAAGLPANCGANEFDGQSEVVIGPLDRHLGMLCAQWNDAECDCREDAVNLLLEMAVHMTPPATGYCGLCGRYVTRGHHVDDPDKAVAR